jgi:hypothetical protein
MTHVSGGMELRGLALRLKAAGNDGKGLKKNLYKKMNEAVVPLADKVTSVEHLRKYLPNRYADTLAADLSARISKGFFAQTPRIEVIAKGRQHRRKVVLLDSGLINHPVYARGTRVTWNWSNSQTGGMHPGFFSDAVKDETPQMRDKILQAMTETAREITGNP